MLDVNLVQPLAFVRVEVALGDLGFVVVAFPMKDHQFVQVKMWSGNFHRLPRHNLIDYPALIADRLKHHDQFAKQVDKIKSFIAEMCGKSVVIGGYG